MAQKCVLLIGLDPALVDFSRSAAGRTPEQVTAAGHAAVEQLQSLGYEVQNCLIDLGKLRQGWSCRRWPSAPLTVF